MDPSDQEDDHKLPVSNAIDNQILMHRDVHFGGDFNIMLDYYNKGGIGVNPEFEMERIQELADIEARTQKNLAGIMLTGAEAETVFRAKEAYKTLRDLYDTKGQQSKNPLLIADLILSEEEDPQKEIEAIVAQRGLIVPALIDLVRSHEFYDPLFPGYGNAPALAIRCLGKIGDRRSMMSLFETIGEADFFSEDIVLQALKQMGEPAKSFLVKVLHGRPLNIDNERAAIALVNFKDDPEVAQTCFKMLQEPDVKKDIALSTYLILCCEGLTSTEDRKKFSSLADDPSFKHLRLDIKAVSNSWK